MKKVICLVLSLVMFASVSVGVGLVVTADSRNNFEYTVLEDGTAEITKYNGNEMNVNIPSTIDGYEITVLGYLSFAHCTTIKNLTIPNSIKTIERNAFLGCSSIQKLIIPGSVQVIKYSAFGECTSLKNVIFTEGISTISQWAFEGCSSLTSVVIPKSVNTLGSECFIDCTSLKYTVILNENCKIYESFCVSNGENRFPFEDFIIYGYKNSTAQLYAEKNNYEFVEIDEPILDDSNSRYVISSNSGATIRCTYNLDDFVSVTIDGETVNSSNYTVSEGSTILTFSPAYLNTLSVGDHTVTLNYTNTTVTGVLSIVGGLAEAQTDSNEPTADADKVKTTASNITDNAKENLNKDTQLKSPDTGGPNFFAAIVAVAAVVSGTILIILKKKHKV